MFLYVVNLISLLLLSAILTGLLIPQILRIAFQKKLFDGHDSRKIHKGIVPRLGGTIFLPVIFCSVLFLLGVNFLFGQHEIFLELRQHTSTIIFGSCSMIIIYLVGVMDDLVGVRYRTKFFFQILCGVLLVASGLWISNLYGLFGIYELPKYIGYPLTILMVIFIINALNLIDGIDGLAAGLSSITLLLYGIIFLFLGKILFSFLSFATLGVLVAFLYFNIFGKADQNSKIFMGDAGALTLGLILSALCIELCRYDFSLNIIFPHVIIPALVPLLIPCFDVFRVVMVRISNKSHPFKADANHIHHKLLKAGFTQRWALVILLSVSLIYIGSNLFLSRFLDINILLIMDILLWLSGNMLLNMKIRQHLALAKYHSDRFDGGKNLGIGS